MSQTIKSRIVKPLAIVAGLVVVLVAAGGLFIGLWLDPNNYKGTIQRLAAEQGVDLQLRGQIGWQLWPSLAISLEDVQLASTRTPEQPLAQLQQLAVVVELAPLLQRRISVAAIEVDGAAFDLRRDQTGRTNWEIEAVTKQAQSQPQSQPQLVSVAPLTADAAINITLFAVAHASDNATTSTTTSSETAEAAAEPLNLAIQNISLKDVSLRYEDASTGQRVTLANLSLDIDGLNQDGELFPVQLSADVEQLNDLPGVKVTIDGDISLQDQQLQLQPLGLVLEPLAGGKTSPLKLELTGQLGLPAGFTEIGDMELQLALEQLNLRQWLAALDVPLDTANAQALTNLEMSANIKGSGSVLKVSNLQVSLDDTTIKGDIGYNQPDQLALLVNLNIDKINADDYLSPPEKGGSSPAAKKASAKKAADDSTAYDSTDSTVTVGKATLDGSANTGDSSTDTPMVIAAAPAAKKAKASVAAGPDKRQPDERLPFDMLRDLRMQLQLNIGELQVAQAQLADVALRLRSNVGVAHLDTLSFKGYKGTFNSKGQLDSRRSQARLHLEGSLAGVELLGLLSDTLDEKRLQGAANMTFSADSEGSSVAELQRQLSADVKLQAKALQMNDLDVERDLCQLAESLGGSKVAGQSWKGYTKLQDVSGNFVLRNEIVQVKSFNAGMEALTVAARGNAKIDIANKSFDLPVDAKVTGARDDTLACQIRDRWRNLDLPLRCRGSFDNIGARTCLPDQDRLAVLLKQQGVQEAQQQLSDKLREKLGDEDGKQVEDLLRGLLGR